MAERPIAGGGVTKTVQRRAQPRRLALAIGLAVSAAALNHVSGTRHRVPNVSASAKDPVEMKLNYAWGWFSYHAGQRFVAFNFFVVVAGALAVAYADAVTHRSEVLGAAVAFLFGFLALVFWVIDFRNKQLVDCGQLVLEDLEEDPYLGISIAKKARASRKHILNHTDAFRAILAVFFCSAILAAMWALNGFAVL